MGATVTRARRVTKFFCARIAVAATMVSLKHL